MREVKFRAWHKEERRMYYDICTNGEEHFIWSKYMKMWVPLKGNSEDIILMQYTGFKDRNGRGIYEGDILKGPEGIATVKWERGKFVVWADDLDDLDLSKEEVIGNIYENPELIAKEAQQE